jgi:hypothetical protein
MSYVFGKSLKVVSKSVIYNRIFFQIQTNATLKPFCFLAKYTFRILKIMCCSRVTEHFQKCISIGLPAKAMVFLLSILYLPTVEYSLGLVNNTGFDDTFFSDPSQRVFCVTSYGTDTGDQLDLS